jgi:hypothetical protein
MPEDAPCYRADLARIHHLGYGFQREYVGDTLEIRRLVLPDDPIPQADAIISIGHVLNYLPDADAIKRALVAIAGAMRPDGLLAIDMCDRSYHEAASAPDVGARVTDDWAIIAERSLPTPDRFREPSMSRRRSDGSRPENDRLGPLGITHLGWRTSRAAGSERSPPH